MARAYIAFVSYFSHFVLTYAALSLKLEFQYIHLALRAEILFFVEPTPTMSALEVGLDGSPLRTEHANKHMLSTIGLHVMDAKTYGRNECLSDAIMQSLQHSGFLRSTLTVGLRNPYCYAIRKHLQDKGLTRNDVFDYLSHDLHVSHIIDFLLTPGWSSIWCNLYKAQRCEFTVIVYDRFQNRALRSIHGDVLGELPQTEPVRIRPKYRCTQYCPEVSFVQILLYANTHRDGTGWHYEWIQPQAIVPEKSISARSSSTDVTSTIIVGETSGNADPIDSMILQHKSSCSEDPIDSMMMQHSVPMEDSSITQKPTKRKANVPMQDSSITQKPTKRKANSLSRTYWWTAMGFVQTRPTSGGDSKDNDVESNSDSSDGCDEVCINVGPLRCLKLPLRCTCGFLRCLKYSTRYNRDSASGTSPAHA